MELTIFKRAKKAPTMLNPGTTLPASGNFLFNLLTNYDLTN